MDDMTVIDSAPHRRPTLLVLMSFVRFEGPIVDQASSNYTPHVGVPRGSCGLVEEIDDPPEWRRCSGIVKVNSRDSVAR